VSSHVRGRGTNSRTCDPYNHVPHVWTVHVRQKQPHISVSQRYSDVWAVQVTSAGPYIRTGDISRSYNRTGDVSRSYSRFASWKGFSGNFAEVVIC
jgi:hypothetical protein